MNIRLRCAALRHFSVGPLQRRVYTLSHRGERGRARADLRRSRDAHVSWTFRKHQERRNLDFGMSCGEVLRELSNYIDGVVSLELQRRMEAHLQACTACTATLEGTRSEYWSRERRG